MEEEGELRGYVGVTGGVGAAVEGELDVVASEELALDGFTDDECVLWGRR